MKYIFVHGLGQNASSWDKTKECLADKLEMVIPELSEFIREGNCTYSKIYSSFCEYCNAFSEPALATVKMVPSFGFITALQADATACSKAFVRT